MSEKLERLLKTDDGTATPTKVAYQQCSKDFKRTKRKINMICKGLCTETDRYRPEISARIIQGYLDEKKIDRMLYSEISSYVFSLKMKERATFSSNVEMLLLYVLDDEHEISSDCRKMTVKIYDHFQLALHQIENVNNILAEGIEEAKSNLKQEIKGIEKEYISILGIFAAIVLAFVGGITFSSSVLQNMSSSGIYRLLLVVDLLAFILINVIYILIKFVMIINGDGCEMQDLKVEKINRFCFIFALMIAMGWILNLRDLPQFFRSFLPWCK